MQKLVKKATDTVETPWGLDWFVQAGHGGNGNRNCTLPEDATLATPAYLLSLSTTGAILGPNTTWQNSNPPIQPKGLVNGTPPAQNMWRWQALQEFQYPLIEYLRAFLDKPLFLGNESVVAGHEHSSMSVITGQIPLEVDFQRLPNTPPYNALGNATALSQFNYCFDAGDPDTSRGNTTVGSTVGNNWDCSNPTSPDSTSAALGFNDAAKKIIPVGPGLGTKGHAKTVEGMKWMATFHPDTSYYVPAHLERAGPFNPEGNNGFNVESLRDFNNAAPRIAFGFETQPGHGASDTRGEYIPRRNNIGGTNIDSVGGTTYGGTGVYGAQIGGVWDALLGEGRNWWFFASSDWHTRGTFGPDDRRTQADFYPGEYQRTYALVRHGERDGHDHGAKLLRPQSIVDGLRTGNAYATQGQLIDRLAFIVCEDRSESSAESAAVDAAQDNAAPEKERCATMGEKLVVSPGSDISVAIVVRDPEGANFSPYSFNNPSLAQVGIHQPINRPVLDHVDVIRGMVSGFRTPGAADYAGAWPNNWFVPYLTGATPSLATVPAAAKNTSAAVIKTFNDHSWATLNHDRQFQGDDVQDLERQGVAVRAPARQQHAGERALRDRRERQSAAGHLHQRGGDQRDPDRRGRRLPGGQLPEDRMHGHGLQRSGQRHRLHGRQRPDRRLPESPVHQRVRSEARELRRGGMVGPVVLQQPDLHRSAGLDEGRGRQVKRGEAPERRARKSRGALFVYFG